MDFALAGQAALREGFTFASRRAWLPAPLEMGREIPVVSQQWRVSRGRGRTRSCSSRAGEMRADIQGRGGKAAQRQEPARSYRQHQNQQGKQPTGSWRAGQSITRQRDWARHATPRRRGGREARQGQRQETRAGNNHWATAGKVSPNSVIPCDFKQPLRLQGPRAPSPSCHPSRTSTSRSLPPRSSCSNLTRNERELQADEGGERDIG